MKLNELVCPKCGLKCMTDCSYTTCASCGLCYQADQSRSVDYPRPYDQPNVVTSPLVVQPYTPGTIRIGDTPYGNGVWVTTTTSTDTGSTITN